MFIVCVAACPTGVAHTYMAAESLDIIEKKEAMKLKLKLKGVWELKMRLPVTI
ncbi:hypothetical protein [Providencia hangzhouensis]|uniref:hypothetical protein n=1 Tax=Providencia hangzhouensis TaxID=3031799 RepID=UPI003F6920F5